MPTSSPTGPNTKTIVQTPRLDKSQPSCNPHKHLLADINACHFSLRMLLHRKQSSEQNRILLRSHNSEREELDAAHAFVKRVLEESLANLLEEESDPDILMRWELGACWIQHLQDQNTAEKDKKQSGDTAKSKQQKVEGLGKPLKVLKNPMKKVGAVTGQKTLSDDGRSADEAFAKLPSMESQGESEATENELVLKNLLTGPAFIRLKESETGLHRKVCIKKTFLIK